MATRVGGFRRKTRSKLKKGRRDKGKLSITRFFQKFEVGAPVSLAAEPAYQKGMYFPRFHGQRGVVKGMQGQCYKVQIKANGGKERLLIVHPIHLRRA